MFRRQLVGMLSAEGMSNRSIASTVQVDERTVRRDQVRQHSAPEVGPLDPPSSDPDPDISAVVSPVSAPSAATPEQRRRPLPPQIRNAVYDLELRSRQLENLAEDDRFKKSVTVHDVNSVKWTLERLEKVAQAFESAGVTE